MEKKTRAVVKLSEFKSIVRGLVRESMQDQVLCEQVESAFTEETLKTALAEAVRFEETYAAYQKLVEAMKCKGKEEKKCKAVAASVLKQKKAQAKKAKAEVKK